MKSLYLIKPAILLLIATSFHTIAVKAQSAKNVSLNSFSAVSVSAGIKLFLTHGNSESAKIIADDDLINDLVVENNGTGVQVKWKEKKKPFSDSWKSRTAKVYITYKNLNSITASSGSSIQTENVLKADRLDAKVSSGADIKATISCKDLKTETSSGASISLSGTAVNMDLKSSSGSSVEALDLPVDYAKVTASSGANVKVNVTKGLETISSSGGNINYKGNADVKNSSSSKSSNVRKIG